jgi:hypothetical protein
VAGDIRFHLLLRQAGELRAGSYGVIAEVRDEWLRALGGDSSTAGFLHCGDTQLPFTDIEPFWRSGRMVISDSARQLLPEVLTSKFRMLGFLVSAVARRMKVLELLEGWSLGEEAAVPEPAVPEPSATQRAPEQTAAKTLLEGVENVIQQRRAGQSEALRARLGMAAPRTTLQEAADFTGVTRERIRQVEERFLDDFLAAPVSTELLQHIEALRAAEERPLLAAELPGRDDWFAGLRPESDLIGALLPAASRGALQVIESPLGAIICDARVPSWQAIVRSAVDAVRNLPAGAERSRVVETVDALLAPCSARELLDDVLVTVEEQVYYSENAELLAVGDTQKVIATAILRASDRPLHFTEVAERWTTQADEPVSPRTVQSALKRGPDVRLFGRGTYGLDQHIGLAPETVASIVTECELVMTGGRRSRQWHTSELLSLVKEARTDLPDTVDKYVLDACLSRSEKVVSVGRLMWSIREAGFSLQQRIELHEAAESVLRRAGRPLSEAVLRARVGRDRGFDPATFLLTPRGELARLAPGVWGLVERDFGLGQAQRDAVVEELVAVLQARGSALHLSEMVSELSPKIRLPKATTSYMLQQLGVTDSRLRLFHGDLIGLSEWGEARRPSGRQAMEMIGRTLEGGVTLDWLHRELERTVQRPLDRLYVSAIVRNSSLVYDRDEKVWRRGALSDPQ